MEKLQPLKTPRNDAILSPRIIGAGVAVIALGALAVFGRGLFDHGGQAVGLDAASQPPAASASSSLPLIPGRHVANSGEKAAFTDGVSPAEQKALLDHWQSATPVKLPAVTPQETTAAIASLQLDPLAAAAVKADAEAGKVKLVWLYLWDDRAEDGDAVTVTSGGMTVTVTLSNVGTEIALPVENIANEGGLVMINGLRDGAGGGITLGVQTVGGAPLHSPALNPGDVLPLPVLFR